MKLLIVDDSAIARNFLKKCLPKELEYEITECSNGLEGFETYKKLRPDLTFMDLTMPVMDGMEALEKIKEIDDEAVVFVLTADIQKKTYDKIMSLGASKFLKKPPTRENIGNAVNEFADFLNRKK